MTPVSLPKSPSQFLFSFVAALVLARVALPVAAQDVPTLNDLWRDRIKSVVAVEFYIEAETERRPVVTGGLVLDRDGTVALQPTIIPNYVPASQLKDFRVYRPGAPVTDFGRAEYLGPDAVTGWNYVRVDEATRKLLTPISEFARATPTPLVLGQDIWGMGMRGKDEDFEPYLIQSRIALLADLPQRTAFAMDNVSAPQLPVFTSDGTFAGVGLAGFGETFYQYSRTERGSPILLVSGDETRVFRAAVDLVPYLGRVPQNTSGRPASWLGVMGLQPLPLDVAKYLHVENQSALVVSEVNEDGPAAAAGMKDRDIIVGFEGKPLPRLKPAHVAIAWIERELALRAPGTLIHITVLRGTERIEITPTLRDEPKMLREAERKYFDRIGLTVREFLQVDAVSNRVKMAESRGVTIHFVKPNSPAAAAGLRAEDWLREIDGAQLNSFEDAVNILGQIEKDETRPEFILLISRAGETSVLRVKTK
jgi:serine protease Do